MDGVRSGNDSPPSIGCDRRTIPFSKNERRSKPRQLPRFNIYEINILLGRRVFVLTIDSHSALKIVPLCITDYAY